MKTYAVTILLRLVYLFVASAIATLVVFRVGVPAAGDNPGAVGPAIPFFFGTYAVLVLIEMILRVKKAHLKSPKLGIFLSTLFSSLSLLLTVILGVLVLYFKPEHFRQMEKVIVLFIVFFFTFESLAICATQSLFKKLLR